MKEIPETVPSFWNATQGSSSISFLLSRASFSNGLAEFVAQHPSYIAKENSMRWISPNRGRTFNYCHCELSIAMNMCIAELTGLGTQGGATLRSWT
jgi:hypothetical protein